MHVPYLVDSGDRYDIFFSQVYYQNVIFTGKLSNAISQHIKFLNKTDEK